MAISDSWPPLEASLEQLDEATAKRITSLHSHLLPHSTLISDYATSLHPHHLPCTLITSTFTWGQSFLVYELVFDRGQLTTTTTSSDDHQSEEEAARGGDGGDKVNGGRSDQSESWVARFGLPPYEGDEFFNTPEQLERKILNEVGALRVVKERTTVPVPTIFGFCPRHGTGFQQKFGGIIDEDDSVKRKPHPLGESFPAFILMSALRGKTIEECGIPIHELGGHWEATPASSDDSPYFASPILQNYLASLANIHMQLSQVTFDQIGSFTMDDETGEVRIGPMAEFGLGPFNTAEEYYATLAEAFKRLAEAAEEEEMDEDEEEEDDEPSEVVLTIEGEEKGENTTVTLSSAQVRSLRRLFTAAIFPLALGPHISPSNDRGPFPLRHGDLHSENILVDEETGNIVGVIDWEGAGTVPWEVAGGLNWEVQGDVSVTGGADGESGKGASLLQHPEIHSAFNHALKQAEVDLVKTSSAKKQQQQAKSKVPVSRPAQLNLSRSSTIEQPPKLPVLPGSPTDAFSPSTSSLSLCSSTSTSSSSSENTTTSDFDFTAKSHSRSSSSSKTNLTAFTSPPTSPASSMFNLCRKEKEKEKDQADDSSVVLVPPASVLSVSPISILNTPPSPPSTKPSVDDTTEKKKSVFTRAASEPHVVLSSQQQRDEQQQQHQQPQSQHTRSVSLSPVIIEAIREPLPADYHKQMVNKSELSLCMAAMSIRSPPTLSSSSSSALLSTSPSNGAAPSIHHLTTPTSSVLRSPPTPGGLGSPHPRHRGALHRRKQSSIVLSSLPPLMHPGPLTPATPSAVSPSIPFNLYGPPLHAPPPLLAGSLSLPPLPIRRHGSPSPTPSPSGSPKHTPKMMLGHAYGDNQHVPKRSPSPLSTPLAVAGGAHPHQQQHHPHPHPHPHHHYNHTFHHSPFSFPRTPTASHHNHHQRTPSASTASASASAVSYFLPPSLSRSVSAGSASGKTAMGSGSVGTLTATPTTVSTPTTVVPLSRAMSARVESMQASQPQSQQQEEPPASPIVAETPQSSLPVTSPSGSSLSDLHASVGTYVASYLAHWMFVFGCEYETVGKALWEIVLCARKDLGKQCKDAEGVDVEEAFWVWVKETLGNTGDEEGAEQAPPEVSQQPEEEQEKIARENDNEEEQTTSDSVVTLPTIQLPAKFNNVPQFLDGGVPEVDSDKNSWHTAESSLDKNTYHTAEASMDNNTDTNTTIRGEVDLQKVTDALQAEVELAGGRQ